jgi:glycerol kinase
MRAVLALDQGGHASRACLVGEHGKSSPDGIAIRTTHGSGGEVEHEAGEIVHSLHAAAMSVLRR